MGRSPVPASGPASILIETADYVAILRSNPVAVCGKVSEGGEYPSRSARGLYGPERENTAFLARPSGSSEYGTSTQVSGNDKYTYLIPV